MKRALFGALAAVSILVGGSAVTQSNPVAAQRQNQQGLVNVGVGDVTVLENVGVGVAAQLVAQICGVSVGNVAALASGILQNQEAATICETIEGDQEVPVTITPAQDNGGGPNQNQDGLVNVAVGDITILQNVGVGVAAQVVAQICGLSVGNVAALTSLVLQNQETDTVCEAGLGDQTAPITISPAQE